MSASQSASLGCWMKSVLITSLIVTCLLATITDSIRQNVCLRADIPALTTVQCPLNHQIQIHNAYAGVQSNLDCSDNRVAAEGCTHSHSDKTEAFRSACNSVIERCYVNVTYSEPDRYCLDEVPLGQPYINVQYQCRPVMDPFGHPAIVIDPMLVDTVSYSHIPKITLQSVNYPTMSSSFGNTTCRFMLASSNTLRIDTYEMTYQGDSVEPPYCIMFGDQEECAEVAGVFQVKEPSGDTNVSIIIRDSAAISGRFWIDLAALFTSDRTYTYMDVECSGDLMTRILSSSSTPSTTRRGVTPSATVPSLPPSITTSTVASTTPILSAISTTAAHVTTLPTSTTLNTSASTTATSNTAAHVTTLPTSTTLNTSASTTSSITTSMSVTTQANTTPSSHSTTSPTPPPSPTKATEKSQPFITSTTRVSTTAPSTQSMIRTPAMSQSFTTPTPSTSRLPSITPTTSTSSTSASPSPSPSPSHASPSYTSPTKTASVTTAGRITVASTPSSTSTSTILTTLQSTSTSTFSTMSPVISSPSIIHTTGSMASTSSSSTTKPTTSTLSSSTASMPSVSSTVTTSTLSSTAKLLFSSKSSTGSTRSSEAWSTPSRATVSSSSSSAFTTITTITDSNLGERVRLNKKESPVSKGLIIGLVVAIVAVTVIGAILIKFASKKRTEKDDERILIAHDENNIEQNGGPHLVHHPTDETIGQGIATENFNTTVC